MLFKPTNRYLLVEAIEEEQDESTILLPEDYKLKRDEYVLVKVRDWAVDCKLVCQANALAVVNEKMIESIIINNITYDLILENYVIGFLSES